MFIPACPITPGAEQALICLLSWILILFFFFFSGVQFADI